MRHIISSITSAVPAGWLMRIVIHTLESGDMAELHHSGPGDQHLLIDVLMMSPSLAESSIHIQYRMHLLIIISFGQQLCTAKFCTERAELYRIIISKSSRQQCIVL